MVYQNRAHPVPSKAKSSTYNSRATESHCISHHPYRYGQCPAKCHVIQWYGSQLKCSNIAPSRELMLMYQSRTSNSCNVSAAVTSSNSPLACTMKWRGVVIIRNVTIFTSSSMVRLLSDCHRRRPTPNHDSSDDDDDDDVVSENDAEKCKWEKLFFRQLHLPPQHRMAKSGDFCIGYYHRIASSQNGVECKKKIYLTATRCSSVSCHSE